jgi:hypothetical protein
MGLEVLEPLEELAARQGWACGTEEITFGVGMRRRRRRFACGSIAARP